MIEVQKISIHDLVTHTSKDIDIPKNEVIISNEEVDYLKRFLSRREQCSEDDIFLHKKILQ